MKSKYVIFIAVATLVSIAGWYFLENKGSEVANQSNERDVYIHQGAFVIEEEGVSRGGAVVASGIANQSVRYTQLVEKYQGKRIQFDAMCQAIVSSSTYKNNSLAMFDNRSGDARVITIGGVDYNFPGYGYKILNISGNNLPASVSFNCGSAVNVGSILIQN